LKFGEMFLKMWVPPKPEFTFFTFALGNVESVFTVWLFHKDG